MLPEINFAADAIIWLGAMWIVLTSKIMTRTWSSMALAVIGISSLGNIISPNPCPVWTETLLKAGVASLVSYAWARIELKQLISKRAW